MILYSTRLYVCYIDWKVWQHVYSIIYTLCVLVGFTRTLFIVSHPSKHQTWNWEVITSKLQSTLAYFVTQTTDLHTNTDWNVVENERERKNRRLDTCKHIYLWINITVCFLLLTLGKRTTIFHSNKKLHRENRCLQKYTIITYLFLKVCFSLLMMSNTIFSPSNTYTFECLDLSKKYFPFNFLWINQHQ